MSRIGFTTPSTSAASNQATEAERLWWSSAVARYTRIRREKLGLSVEEAAELSGLELSQWLALEDNWIPEDLCVVLAIAMTLRVEWSDLDLIALIARGARETGQRTEC